MILYLDTSALVKLYVRESGSRKVRDLVNDADIVSTSRVAYPEARAAFARCAREGALGGAAIRRVRSDLDRDMRSIVVVELREDLAGTAGDLAEEHGLRGFDAVHLASALEIGRLMGEMPSFAAFDDRLLAAAAACGLRVV